MGKKIYILVVDDEESICQTLEGILVDEGYNVSTAEDGYEAVEKTKKNPFDLIFMDVKLPRMNGVTTYKKIKKIRPKTQVVMMTGYSVEELLKEAKREGAYAIIYKPVEMEKVLSLINEIRGSLG